MKLYIYIYFLLLTLANLKYLKRVLWYKINDFIQSHYSSE